MHRFLAALDTWVSALDPAPADPDALKAAMRPLVRAIVAAIKNNAVVNLAGVVDGDAEALFGTGTLT